MRRVFSTLLLMLLFPVKKIRLAFKDNFYSGLILGAIFSLVVNVISMQVQVAIEKQRVLEAVESEIVTHRVIANSMLTSALRARDKKDQASIFYTPATFSTNIWDQSTEPHQYVAQLDPKIQTEINIYYSFSVPSANDMIHKLSTVYETQLAKCFDFTTARTIVEQNICDERFYKYQDDIAYYPGKSIHESAVALLNIFHPTQDRLSSPWMRLLMGSNSMKILSGN